MISQNAKLSEQLIFLVSVVFLVLYERSVAENGVEESGVLGGKSTTIRKLLTVQS